LEEMLQAPLSHMAGEHTLDFGFHWLLLLHKHQFSLSSQLIVVILNSLIGFSTDLQFSIYHFLMYTTGLIFKWLVFIAIMVLVSPVLINLFVLLSID
jgi:hypothetical protein